MKLPITNCKWTSIFPHWDPGVLPMQCYYHHGPGASLAPVCTLEVATKELSAADGCVSRSICRLGAVCEASGV